MKVYVVLVDDPYDGNQFINYTLHSIHSTREKAKECIKEQEKIFEFNYVYQEGEVL